MFLGCSPRHRLADVNVASRCVMTLATSAKGCPVNPVGDKPLKLRF
jgi:hypothetical protein